MLLAARMLGTLSDAEDIVGSDVDPADRVTLDDSVRMTLLVVLEQRSPAKRTVFVLRDVFGVGFDGS